MDFFEEDDQRRGFIVQKNDEGLKKSYKISKSVTTNIPEFWNKKITTSLEDSHFDRMTKYRVKTSVDFLPKTIDNVLDIGVGYGYFEKELKERKIKTNIHGIDIAHKGLKLISAKVKGIFRVGSILKIPFGKNYFDCVIVMEVLEHIPARLVLKAYREIKRVLKKNGTLIASVPINEKYTVNNNPNQHMRRYSRELFFKELELNGFKVKRFRKFYAFKNLYTLKTLLGKIFINKWKPNVILVKAVVSE